MANLLKKISDLPAGTPLETDIIPYVDLVAGATKKALKSELKGVKGDDASVDVGTTITLAPGASATVVNSGTTQDAVFNFGIPQGEKGDKGDAGTGATVVTTLGTPGSDDNVPSEKLMRTELNLKLATSAKATQAEVATGTDDTKYTTPLAVAPYANNSLYRQAIINGNFDVWQRGTSVALSVANGYTADRWRYDTDVGGVATITRESFTVGQTVVPNNPEYFLRINQTTGADAGKIPNIQQRIEGVKNFSNGNVTLSFWARVSSGTIVITPTMRQFFGTGGSPSASVIVTADPITINTDFTKYTITFAMPSISGKTVGTTINTDFVSLRLEFPAETTFTVDIAQVQLNAGSVALPFMPKSYAEELRDCQRYYMRFTDFRTPVSSVTTAAVTSASIILSSGMRIPPVTTLSGSRGTDWYLRYKDDSTNTTGTFSGSSSSNGIAKWAFTGGTFNAGEPYHIIITNTGALELSAEL